MCNDGLNNSAHAAVHNLDVEESIKCKITTYIPPEKSKKISPGFSKNSHYQKL